MTERTCNNCGWVAFAVTREYAEAEVAKFNAWFDKQTQVIKDAYGGTGSSIGGYERCMSCGGPYTNFRASKPGDAPNGCTLNPIIYP